MSGRRFITIIGAAHVASLAIAKAVEEREADDAVMREDCIIGSDLVEHREALIRLGEIPYNVLAMPPMHKEKRANYQNRYERQFGGGKRKRK